MAVCKPPFRPNLKTFVSAKEHNRDGRKIWYLLIGYGLFTAIADARNCDPRHGAGVLKFPTREAAERAWAKFCRQNHNHPAGFVPDSSPEHEHDDIESKHNVSIEPMERKYSAPLYADDPDSAIPLDPSPPTSSRKRGGHTVQRKRAARASASIEPVERKFSVPLYANDPDSAIPLNPSPPTSSCKRSAQNTQREGGHKHAARPSADDATPAARPPSACLPSVRSSSACSSSARFPSVRSPSARSPSARSPSAHPPSVATEVESDSDMTLSKARAAPGSQSSTTVSLASSLSASSHGVGSSASMPLINTAARVHSTDVVSKAFSHFMEAKFTAGATSISRASSSTLRASTLRAPAGSTSRAPRASTSRAPAGSTSRAPIVSTSRAPVSSVRAPSSGAQAPSSSVQASVSSERAPAGNDLVLYNRDTRTFYKDARLAVDEMARNESVRAIKLEDLEEELSCAQGSERSVYTT